MFCIGVTGSGFPFDFGRNPYKGKRPLKDIIGSYKNRHSSGDPSSEGLSGSGNISVLASEMQLQVQSQQEELERLKKELSSQKVNVSCLLSWPTSASQGPRSKACLCVLQDFPSSLLRDLWVTGRGKIHHRRSQGRTVLSVPLPSLGQISQIS